MRFDADVPIEWQREFAWGGSKTAYRLGRAGSAIVAEWIDVGVLRASPDGSAHEFCAYPGASEREAERVARTIVPSLVRHLRGELALHASAVVAGSEAIAFLGGSGAGKSTIAAELSQQDCVALAADDVAFVESSRGAVRLTPTENVHRLLVPGECRRKQLVPARRVAVSAARLAVLVLLSTDRTSTGPRLVPLSGAAAFAAVNDALVRFVTDDAGRNARDFETVANLASVVPVLELQHTMDIGLLPRTAAMLLEYLYVGKPL